MINLTEANNINSLLWLTIAADVCNNGLNKTRQGYAAMHLNLAGCFFLGICNV